MVAAPADLLGAAALTIGGLSALALGARHDGLHWFACLVVIQAIYGLPGVAFASIGVVLMIVLSTGPGRTSVAAVPVALAAAVLATALPVLNIGAWEGPVLSCFAAGAPGLAFVGAATGRDRSPGGEGPHLAELGPALVAIVLGAWLWGACGAAGAMAMGVLTRPFMHLLGPGPRAGRRRRRAILLAGTLTGGLVGFFAGLAGMRLSPVPGVAACIAVPAALGAYFVALRVHASVMARLTGREIRRMAGRLRRPNPAQNWHAHPS